MMIDRDILEADNVDGIAHEDEFFKAVCDDMNPGGHPYGIKYETRGQHLMRVLKLEGVKRERRQGKMDVRTQREKRKDITYKMRTQDFVTEMDHDGICRFTHPTWKGTWCIGGPSAIRKYVAEIKKPVIDRDFSWLHLYG